MHKIVANMSAVLFYFTYTGVTMVKRAGLTHGVLPQCETVIGSYVDHSGLVKIINLELLRPLQFARILPRSIKAERNAFVGHSVLIFEH